LTKRKIYGIIYIENEKGDLSMTQKEITDQMRARFTEDLMQFLATKYDTDVCQTASNTIMIPTVDDAGEDRWVKFTIVIPKEADEAAGNDGYSLQRDYQLKVAKAAERKAKQAEKAAKAKSKEVKT